MIKGLERLTQLMAEYSSHEGPNKTLMNGFEIYKSTKAHSKIPMIYEPLICLVGQGEKNCYIGNKTYSYKSGDFLITFLPVPVESAVVSATVEKPMLAVALTIDLGRIADIVLKIERSTDSAINYKDNHINSNIFTGRAEESLIDPFIRLLEASQKEVESEILGNSIIDEIYYRMLTSESGTALRTLLNQSGDFQRISRAIEYIHKNLNQTVNIQDLAQTVFMNKTSFFEAFKRVMQISPLQYIKSTRLQKAQVLLKEGKNVTEASHLVGYNSFSQFSREYKRYFGFVPSET